MTSSDNKRDIISRSGNLHCLEHFREDAEQLLDKRTAGYLSGPANDGITYEENTKAFKRYKFRPKLLRDVSIRDLSTTVLGENISIPIGVSPFGIANVFHSKGELALAKAVERIQTCYIQSHWSSRSVEDVNQASPSCLKWIQIFIYENREITTQLVKRAERLGYKAVVLTVDTPIVGRRIKDMKNSFKFEDLGGESAYEEILSRKLSTDNKHALIYDQTVTWKDIQWLKQQTKLPVVVKGIMTDTDARQAIKNGADAIMVSNHGGRQLDGVPATIDVLEEIVNEVSGACEVYLDGGVRSGTDVLKALALGAKAVFIGRPAAWGLTCDGEDGVVRVLSLLREELDISMALCGIYHIFVHYFRA